MFRAIPLWVVQAFYLEGDKMWDFKVLKILNNPFTHPTHGIYDSSRPLKLNYGC